MQKLCNIDDAHVDEYKKYLEDNKIDYLEGFLEE